MPPLNLLAEVLHVEEELTKIRRRYARAQKNPLGKLPFVRSKLRTRQIELDYQNDRIQASKKYLEAITQY